MMKKNWALCVFFTALLTACGGESYPTLTHFKFIDDEFNTTIDTSDSNELSELSALFFDRKEVTGEAPDFKYLVEISRDGKDERWRCSKAGFCRLYVQGESPIYQLERYVELYQKATN